MGNYDIPFLPGHRVCLNPESDNYRRYNENQAMGNAGYIVVPVFNIDAEWIDYKTYSTRSKERLSVRVKWDNGVYNSYMFKDLLHVDSPPKNMIQVRLTNGETYNELVDEHGGSQKLDELIIKGGHAIRSRHTRKFDDAYRNHIIELTKPE